MQHVLMVNGIENQITNYFFLAAEHQVWHKTHCPCTWNSSIRGTVLHRSLRRCSVGFWLFSV